MQIFLLQCGRMAASPRSCRCVNDVASVALATYFCTILMSLIGRVLTILQSF
jgi:hypothetical protein